MVNISLYSDRTKRWVCKCISETYSPVWVPPSGHCNCILGVDSNSFSILYHRRHICSKIRYHSKQYQQYRIFIHRSSLKQMNSQAKFKVLTVVLLRIQVLWDVTFVIGCAVPDISKTFVPSSSGSSSYLTAWSSGWSALTLRCRHYNPLKLWEPLT